MPNNAFWPTSLSLLPGMPLKNLPSVPAFVRKSYSEAAVSQHCVIFLSRIVKLWKEDLGKVNKKAADSLADPLEYENLFPEFQEALLAEKVFLSCYNRLCV